MTFVKALLTAALIWTIRWCSKKWEMFLLRILPLAGAVSASVEIAQHGNVTVNTFALAMCTAFFLTLRLVPALHQEAKSNLETAGHALVGAGRLIRRLLG